MIVLKVDKTANMALKYIVGFSCSFGSLICDNIPDSMSLILNIPNVFQNLSRSKVNVFEKS